MLWVGLRRAWTRRCDEGQEYVLPEVGRLAYENYEQCIWVSYEQSKSPLTPLSSFLSVPPLPSLYPTPLHDNYDELHFCNLFRVKWRHGSQRGVLAVLLLFC